SAQRLASAVSDLLRGVRGVKRTAAVYSWNCVDKNGNDNSNDNNVCDEKRKYFCKAGVRQRQLLCHHQEIVACCNDEQDRNESGENASRITCEFNHEQPSNACGGRTAGGKRGDAYRVKML